jgi:hypothetical protein
MLNVHGRLANTAGMPRKPEPPKSTSWNVYKVAAKAIWLGHCRGPQTKAQQSRRAPTNSKPEAWRLYAVPLR